MARHICHECGRPIEDGEACLTVREKETNRLIYIAHKECAIERKDDSL